MSLLNTASDGLPNVLSLLYSVVANVREPIARDELLEMVAPSKVVADGGAMAHMTLNRWTTLGLFSLDGDKRIAITSPRPIDRKNEKAARLAARQEIRACALSAENNGNLWAREESKAADLTRSLSWLLAQDVYRTSFSAVEQLESEQVSDPELRLMQNSTRKNGLQHWAFFLGFTRGLAEDIDPTQAVAEVLSSCLEVGEEVSAEAFVARLGEVLPVLDGGAYRRSVEENLREGAITERASGQLSTSLSRALLCLRLQGLIVLDQRADTGSGIVLTGRNGARADYRFQTVRRPTAQALNEFA